MLHVSVKFCVLFSPVLLMSFYFVYSIFSEYLKYLLNDKKKRKKKVELPVFQEFFPVVKRSFTLKKKRNSLSNRSRDERKSFSANESYHFFFYIKDLKLSSDVCFLVANFVRLTNIFGELLIWKTGRDKKAGVDDKTEKKSTFISLENYYWNMLL